MPNPSLAHTKNRDKNDGFVFTFLTGFFDGLAITF